MAVVFDQKSESGFVFGSVLEFIKCWEAGSDSRLVLETINGRAWVNFSCCLGRPNANHVVTKRPKSPRKEFKDNMRAAGYNVKARNCDMTSTKGPVEVTVPDENADVTDDNNATESVGDELDFKDDVNNIEEVTTAFAVSTALEIDNNQKEVVKSLLSEESMKKNIEDNIKDVKIDEILPGSSSPKVYFDSAGKKKIQFTFKINGIRGSQAKLKLGLAQLARDRRKLILSNEHDEKMVDLSKTVGACFEEIQT